MSDINQSLLMRALRSQTVERTPIWIMRQAGRYLPEYHKIRQQAGDFLSLCKNPQLACEVTLQPLRRFALDAAILFSDILTIPAAMGLGLYFAEGEGPKFEFPLQDIPSIEKLTIPDMEELSYVMEAVQLIRSEMPEDLPLIGFSGSPWTLACYMVQGEGSRDFKQMLKLMYLEPQATHHLLSQLAQSVTEYLKLQIRSGVNVIQIFDTWGGILSYENYCQFSLYYMTDIIKSLKSAHPEIPVILFTKGAGQWLKDIAETGCDVIGLDWTCHLPSAKKQVGDRVALQGNLDPSVLLTNPMCIEAETKKVIDAYGYGSGHIFNLGHGITPDVPPEHVTALVETVHEYSRQYHK